MSYITVYLSLTQKRKINRARDKILQVYILFPPPRLFCDAKISFKTSHSYSPVVYIATPFRVTGSRMAGSLLPFALIA